MYAKCLPLEAMPHLYHSSRHSLGDAPLWSDSTMRGTPWEMCADGTMHNETIDVNGRSRLAHIPFIQGCTSVKRMKMPGL